MKEHSSTARGADGDWCRDMLEHSSTARGADGIGVRYVVHMSLRRGRACYSNRRMKCLERHGELAQRSFLPSAREGP